MNAKTYTREQFVAMRREYTRRLEESDESLIQVLALLLRIRRMAVDGSVHAKIPDLIEMCDLGLESTSRTPCDMPHEKNEET